MRAADSLERLQDYLHRERERPLEDEARDAMVEAVNHLQRAIDFPGWHEWIRYGLSVPIHAPALPVDIRTAWSESQGKDTEWVDAGSLKTLAAGNTNGTTIDSLVSAGHAAMETKIHQADAEDLKADATAVEKQRKSDKAGLAVTPAPVDVAKAPPKVSARRRLSSISDGIDARLAQAIQNAQMVKEQQARSHLPRPLDEKIEVKTRSHKINYVVQAVRSSHDDDRFVIFGDVLEIGLLTEVLEVANIIS